MSKWETVRLGDVCTPKQWKTISTEMLLDTGYPVYGANGKIGFYSQYTHKEATVLVTCRGATCGSITICEPYSYVNGNAMALDNLSSNVAKEYLALYLKKRGFFDVISGSAQPQIIRQNIVKVEIPLPPLHVQQKIADILDRANVLIEKRKAQIEKLDLLVKSQFIEMFGDPVTNPKGWEVSSMGGYLSLLTDFSANGSYEYLDSNVVMYDEPDFALMVRTTDLEKNDFTNEVKYITENAYNILGKSKLFGGEIIMNKIGSAGKVYLMPTLGFPASLGRNAFMLKYLESINPIFMYFLLTSKYGEREIKQHVRGAVTKTITKDAVRSIPVIVPPISLQVSFADFVERVDAQKSELKKSLELLELNYKSLMQKCFEGEIG